MSPKELLALRLTIDNPLGLYGSEFVSISAGKLSRASIYTILDRLVKKGWIREILEPPTPELSMARTRHIITAKGVREYNKFIAEQGLLIREGAFAR